MGNKFWRLLIVSICIVCIATLGVAYAQKKGEADIKFEAKGDKGAVVFSHNFHVKEKKLKCTDCHPKAFKMKQEIKFTKAEHAEKKYCGICHDGQKAFSMTTEADCAKCHKK